MLTRYKKSGGFLSLLKLIETCDEQKRNKFISIIEGEDLQWAKALKGRMLTFDRVLSWEDSVLTDIARKMPERIMAVILYKIGGELGERFTKELTTAHVGRLKESTSFSEPMQREIEATYVKFIERLRVMITDGNLVLDKVDPDVVVKRDFVVGAALHAEEEKKDIVAEKKKVDKPSTAVVLSSKEGATGVNQSLKKKLQALAIENLKLREENTKLRELLKKVA